MKTALFKKTLGSMLLAGVLLNAACSFADESKIVPFPTPSYSKIQSEDTSADGSKHKIERHFSYTALELVGPWVAPFAPGFSLGLRHQKGHHGADVSVNVSSIYYLSLATADIGYLYYISPKFDQKQWYLGLGFGIGAIDLKKGKYKGIDGYAAPKLMVGSEFTNDKGNIRFAEISVAPAWIAQGGVRFFPVVSVRMGFGF